MMKLINYILLVFSLTLVNAQELEYSQLDNLSFKNYSTTEGLSQRSVVTILQDNKGYLWFGTRYGLNKFDGHIFKNYYYNSTNDNSLSDSWITALAKDNDDNIWIGTKNGLNRYNPILDNFERIVIGTKEGEYLSGEIWDIVIDVSSRLWIATNKGLWYFNAVPGSLTKYVHKENTPSGLSSNLTLSLLKSSNKKIWVCTDINIDVYDPETEIFSHYSYPRNLSPSKMKNNNVILFEDSEKRIWLGYDNGLAYFDKTINSFVEHRMPDGSKPIAGNVRTMYEDENQNLWIGTYEGLFLLHRKNDKVYNYKHNVTIPNSLSQNSVYDIMADSRGDLWIGTWAGGINYLDKSSTVFSSFSEGPDDDDLNYKVVSGIAEDDNQNLWVGTEGGGLNFYDKKNKSFTYYRYDPHNSNSLADNNVKAVIKDHMGNLWVGTHSKGLDYIHVKDGKPIFQHIGIGAEEGANGLSSNRITSIAEDSNYNIWVGTNNGGLNFYSLTNKKFTHIPDHQNILGRFIYTISKSFDGKVLVGGENGMAYVDVATKKITRIPYKENTQMTYGVQKVISTYEESGKNLWIGTEGDGLFQYNFDTNTSKRYGVQEGLPDEVIYGIVPDNERNLWLSTNKGLSRFNPESNEFKNFNLSDGLQGNEFNYGAYLKKENGELIFGGVDGFTVFDPKNIKEDSFMPPIVIQSLDIRNKEIINIPEQSRNISLKHNQNDITFDYVALGYSQANKNEYAYMLEGFDTNWNYVGNSKTATYTNLNHGNYKFKVKATNSDRVWTEKATWVNIVIAPSLWQTWWAYLSYLILITGLFLVIRKYSIQRIQERTELKKERLDRERDEQINRLKLQLFTNISHDFRTPLTLIIGPLKRMIDEKVGDKTIQERLGSMYRNASILLQLINQLLDFRKSEAGKLKLSARKTDVVPFIRDIKLSFEELAKERHIDYKFETKYEHIDVWFDKIEMKKVVLNVLSNAFKFTPRGGNITITISEEKKEETAVKSLNLQISDTGTGIREEDLEFIFDRYFQLGQQNEFRSGTGVGLALAKDIIELHKGHIYVESKEGTGTVFTILLPFGNEHLEPHEIITSSNEDDEDIMFNEFDPSAVKIGWTNNIVQIKDIEEKTVLLKQDLHTLLLVEDNLEVRNFIKSLFTKDYNVLEAANGVQGIEVALSQPIDLIISDVMMPKMDGIEFCKKIKLDINTSHIPVILLTARTSTKVQKIGYDTGADVYITKPFDANLLTLQTANLLKSRQNLIKKFRNEIILEPKKIDLESPDEIFLRKAIGIVEEHISDSDFMASTLVELMHMSQTVLYRKFKALTGQSISEFIRMVKLKRAAQLLVQTDLNIASIAYEVGFNDLKYFRTCFKKVYGSTASQFRKTKVKELEDSK
ncbi:two-component regulator propeller domain-containing protein [Maribacter sp. 2308TA10-17]|uniref:hybrid sensor histidine kinase/response regulator transcription factor n=1 Tax=Maribacter sp. 2308TA10-17 TaxID=3386276 RepID=UPI0039BD2D3E